MTRHSDLIIGSKHLGNSIAHSLKIEFTNEPESVNKMQNEEIEYRSQGLSKLFDHTWTDSEKKEIESRVIKRVNEILNEPKNNDILIKISDEVLEQKIKQHLFQFLKALN